jgi:hypothetical protein
MKLKVIASLGLLSVALAALPGWAQHREPPRSGTARYGDPTSIARAYQDYLYGVIKKIDTNEIVLEKTKFGIDQAFKLDRKTKYIHDGKTGSFDSLKVGDQVWVDVKTDRKTGEMTAKKVLTGVVAPTISR